MLTTIPSIKEKLHQASDDKRKENFQKYFKNQVLCYGVKASFVHKIAKETFKEIAHLQKKEIFSLCEELFRSGFCEEAQIAANWTDQIKKRFLPEDMTIFERWIDLYIDDWAKCDTFCNHAVGALIVQYPKLLQTLKKWALSKKLFLKRASAVSLILPAKKGLFLPDIFEIADLLLLDINDLVQKGYGWMLKEASHYHQQEVFLYVIKNKNQMPRTALRYAIEKMPEDLRKKAMEKPTKHQR
jgi:3-methyladenine DNA glycosylase AlkD